MKLLYQYQTWLIDVGQTVIKKQVEQGFGSLLPIEKLIDCLWVADYGMCNAGDLTCANEVSPGFQERAAQLARDLALWFACESFSLPVEHLEHQYFDRFVRICEEIESSRYAAEAGIPRCERQPEG